MEERKIREVLKQTRILRAPRKYLSTYGSSKVHYYILSESVCDKLTGSNNVDTVIRKGEIIWEQPRLLTPGYLLSMEGFGDEAREALQLLARENPDMAGLLYTLHYKKKNEEMEIVSGKLREVFKKIEREIERKGDPLTTVIKGVPGFWDVSLMKFVHEMVVRSAHFSQFPDLQKEGLIRINRWGDPVVVRDSYGVPIVAKKRIERMFQLVKRGKIDPAILKLELDRWGLFELYEDRFFNLFKK